MTYSPAHIIKSTDERFDTQEEAARFGPITAKYSGNYCPWVAGRLPIVGDYLNLCGYSDMSPYKIIAMSPSGKTATVRAVSVSPDNSVKMEFDAGGFSAHCTNQSDQKWVYGDTEGEEMKVRLVNNGWKSAYGRHKPSAEPHKFHDYNF